MSNVHRDHIYTIDRGDKRAGEGYEIVTHGPLQDDFGVSKDDGANWGAFIGSTYGYSVQTVMHLHKCIVRRPILAATVELAFAGYSPPNDADTRAAFAFAAATPTPGYGFLRPMAEILEDDEYTFPYAAQSFRWERPSLVHSKMSELKYPFRRRLPAIAIASRWSCRHKKVVGEKQCSVCAALYYRSVTT